MTIFVLIFLLLISAVFSLFDYSIDSCRVSRLEKKQEKAYKSLLNVFKTANSKKRLSLACRLWINILRILAALYAGFRIIKIDSLWFLTICIFSILLGILAALLGDALPKLLSRTKPEKIAAYMLPLIKVLTIPMMPFVIPAMKFASFFYKTFNLELKENDITEDELRQALLDGEKHGIVESKERTMVEAVFYLGDRPVGAFMTHRSEIQWLDCNAPYSEIREKALLHRQQRCFPVTNGGPDEIIGAVYLEDIILDTAEKNPRGLRAIMQKAHFVPQSMSALNAFESFKQGHANFLFVMDEYGGLAGVISIRALVEEIVGEFSSSSSSSAAKEDPLIRQKDGSMLADGTLNIDDAVKALSLVLPEDAKGSGDFHTLAGFILFLAGELPQTGDSFVYQNYRFKVKKMDGNRIDKILITQEETE